MRRILSATLLCCALLFSGRSLAMAPDVANKVQEAVQALDEGDFEGAGHAIADAKALAENARDWDGMYTLSIGFVIIDDPDQAVDSYRKGVGYAMDLAGKNCKEGREALQTGVQVFDEVFASRADDDTLAQLRPIRDQADAKAKAACPGEEPSEPTEPTRPIGEPGIGGGCGTGGGAGG